MQVELPAEGLHNKIHANLDAVPVPDLRQCKEAIQILHILEKKNARNRHADIFTKINLHIRRAVGQSAEFFKAAIKGITSN